MPALSKTPRTDALWDPENYPLMIDHARSLEIELAAAKLSLSESISAAERDEWKAMIAHACEKRDAAEAYAVAATELLRRIRAWDMLNPPIKDGSDAFYWRSEIDAVLNRENAVGKRTEDGK